MVYTTINNTSLIDSGSNSQKDEQLTLNVSKPCLSRYSCEIAYGTRFPILISVPPSPRERGGWAGEKTQNFASQLQLSRRVSHRLPTVFLPYLLLDTITWTHAIPHLPNVWYESNGVTIRGRITPVSDPSGN